MTASERIGRLYSPNGLMLRTAQRNAKMREVQKYRPGPAGRGWVGPGGAGLGLWVGGPSLPFRRTTQAGCHGFWWALTPLLLPLGIRTDHGGPGLTNGDFSPSGALC